MTWPPRQPRRDEIEEDERASYEVVIERARRMGIGDPEADAGYYGRLMLSPAMGNQLSEMGRIVRSRGDRGDTYSHADREFVDQVLSVDFGTNVVQLMHLPDALATGVRLEAIEALQAGRTEDLSEDEAQLADFIRRVVAGRVDAGAWEAMEARMGERGVLEYTIFILFLQLTMRLMQAVGMPDPPSSEIEAMIDAFRSGARERPDFRERIT
jgi:hypothetical protein